MGRQECHAWFGGSGAVAAIVAALNLREDWAAAELVPLAAAALANLATPPAAQEQSQGSEASTSPVQCILANTYTCELSMYLCHSLIYRLVRQLAHSNGRHRLLLFD